MPRLLPKACLPLLARVETLGLEVAWDILVPISMEQFGDPAHRAVRYLSVEILLNHNGSVGLSGQSPLNKRIVLLICILDIFQPTPVNI